MDVSDVSPRAESASGIFVEIGEGEGSGEVEVIGDAVRIGVGGGEAEGESVGADVDSGGIVQGGGETAGEVGDWGKFQYGDPGLVGMPEFEVMLASSE
jgi:hypothetical protein